MTEYDNTRSEKPAQNDDLIHTDNTPNGQPNHNMDHLAVQEPVLMLEHLENENHAVPTQPEDALLNESADEAAAAKKAKKKLLKEQRKAKKEPKVQPEEEPVLQLGTAKGVETMFRNAFRTEMELLALAATKANIMISLNGFIVSALMISGAFIFSTSPDFLVPAGIFMTTAAASIVFALLSASPERMGKMRATVEWLKDLFKRKASLKDFKARVYEPEAHFVNESPNILIYEDRVKISKDRYWEMMQDIMANREEVYKKMSEELYWLGSLANKQFKYLNMSYAAFRWGLLISVLAFITIKTLPNVVPSMRADKAAAELRNLGINSFTGLYEPSAVQQLPDGRLLVVEDEHSRAASIVSFKPDGTLDENESVDTRIVRGFKRKLSDLEGLTLDNDGYVYAITSHSRNREGVRRPDREHFIRFKIRGNEVVELSSFNGLVDILESSDQVEQLIRSKIGTMLDFKTINIEGLAYDPNKNRLLLGFRDPEFSDKSMILYIDNPKEMFEQKAKPNFVDVAFLDIKGGGIRSINYDAVLKSYILTNEVKDEQGKKFPQFWLWNGEPTSEAKPIDLPNMSHMTNVEAVDSVKVNGQNRLIFMSDDGDATKNIGGKYMIVEYDKF
ncbi:Pycsar system effector family protein [Neisseria sp. 74A18]|uniref:Pycsar system effector family protein n=1 Tax=Neisseria sp. 74A18 TaxID=1696094 RepID=UPI0006CADB38|nr:Pycsar system effector family protein [Neisseria sp. 74A18]KPN73626.1 hypothetical protein AKG43_06970 [Neisseria sp. 74A18]